MCISLVIMHICFVWSVRGYFIRIQSIACKQSCKQSNNWVRVVCVLTLRLFVAFNFFWIMPLLRHPFIGYFLWTVCFLSPLSIPCTICPRQPHSCCTPKQESPRRVESSIDIWRAFALHHGAISSIFWRHFTAGGNSSFTFIMHYIDIDCFNSFSLLLLH